ncbi:MAG: hypothetical protein HC898_04835 [Phycisphaerales bacterium]|nr:hypothetical protein [Phycisphaerales bacterium]
MIGPEQLGAWTPKTIPYYFSYAWNADLAEGGIKPVNINGLNRLRYDDIRTPSKAILFFELRAASAELDFLPADAPYYYERNEKDLLRMKGDEKHFAGRHFQGGHLAYADGHAAHRKWVVSYEANDWAADGTAGD